MRENGLAVPISLRVSYGFIYTRSVVTSYPQAGYFGWDIVGQGRYTGTCLAPGSTPGESV